ncbi:MAG: aminoglycoside phosphotransferase family protein [Actinomycetota bacterium]
MDEVEVVVAHVERATLRVGDTFLKVDPDNDRIDTELRAIELAPVPTPSVRWRRPPVLALEAVPGKALGVLETPSVASAEAWEAAGAAVRRLHDAPVPALAGRSVDGHAEALDRGCALLLANDVVSRPTVEHNRRLAEGALHAFRPVFAHGDLQLTHVFVDDDDEVTGIIDWSEAGPGDAAYDLATLTLRQEDRLPQVLAGYGGGVDPEIIRGWWSLRCLRAIPWLSDHGFDPWPEIAVLDARMAESRR